MNAVLSPPKLFVRTVPLRDRAGSLVRRLPEGAALAWLSGDDGIVGWGEAARLEPEAAPAGTPPTDNSRIAQAARWFTGLLEHAEVEDEVGLPGTGLVTFGTFTFAPTSPGSALVVPRVLVGRRGDRAWLTTVTDEPVEHPEELLRPATEPRPVGPLEWRPGSLTRQEWMDAVAGTVGRIRAGELEKAVLARDAIARAQSPVDVRVLLERLRTRFPSCFTFSVAGMVGATPELLLRREGDQLTSLVLAGTRPRGEDAESDRRLGQEMMASAKDVEEHGLAVDSLRAALEPLAAELAVPAWPHLLGLANVQHLATRVHARLAPGVSALDAVAALHPTAAVGGTPTETAMRLIGEVEGMDRGGYTGPVGWLDGAGNSEWGIALRCARVDGSSARLYAGGGIVAGSDPAAEAAETESKFRVMREALADPRG
ncbi:isochorismate synthase [Nocardiopsis terrae]|uniref:isochorismate synthase n=1 Tax=Nocardiopsis terrae TaxID=372655 RepID=A0ABR9HG13_9ACTN|nr:isochorismate synthase [Nocardiopsis terrae]MBE1457960.1 menaquinone-specific isochorismate synthase [Nocardiopsis terrae]GHC83311.1 isochorismate synthase [Nocardiopsis terrae]